MAICSSAKRSAVQTLQLLLYDYLAPCLSQTPRIFSRPLTTTPTSRSNDGLHPQTPRAAPEAVSNPSPPKNPLTQAQRDFLASALRVNQAGELAACRIYTAQTPLIVASHPHLRPLMKHMYDQEADHFKTFNHLIAKHRVRPTAMYPLWTLAASALGWSTAIMGREAAMACTEAVETEIGTHYNEQVGWLLEMASQMEKSGEEIGDDLKELIDTIRRIRDEELEHLDHAVENDAQKAVPHEQLTSFIRAGCRGAIWISERV